MIYGVTILTISGALLVHYKIQIKNRMLSIIIMVFLQLYQLMLILPYLMIILQQQLHFPTMV